LQKIREIGERKLWGTNAILSKDSELQPNRH
jgi:hypothetical protein